MPLTPTTPLKHAPDTAWRMVDGQAVVIHAESQRMRVLNAVGSRVWELANNSTPQQIIKTIVDEFDGEPAVVESEVTAFLNELVDKNMLAAG